MGKFDGFLNFVKDKDIQNIDLRFSDTHGKWQHLTFASQAIDSKTLEHGIPFDGSSLAGWRPINTSDMILMPDPSHYVIDPFSALPTVIIFCDVVFPNSLSPYERDPRSIAKKAIEYLQSTGIGDKAYFGPELEFFIFDNAVFDNQYNSAHYKVDSIELPTNSGITYEEGNYGHRPSVKGGYLPTPPVDSGNDIRAEMLATMAGMGLLVEKHHHEVSPAQHELGFEFADLLRTGDNIQIYKYCVHMVAHSYGKTATFMPKPIYGDNGSGMHVHQSIWLGNKNIFAGSKSGNLSQEALWYIGGVFRHSHAVNAFTNPGTNSYKRLVPGFEAPTLLAYSSQNRSASCRIPSVSSDKEKRIEFRFPDCLANPYLCNVSMLMAGLDGIKNKIDPGEISSSDLYALPESELKQIPSVASTLRRALEALDNDREFLKAGNVFTDDALDAYIALKKKEVIDIETHPHPIEFTNYYSR